MEKTKVVIIGAGNVAYHFAHALQQQNEIEIVQIYSRSAQSASLLAQKTNSPYTTEIGQIVSTANLYLFAITDSAICTICTQLHTTAQALWIHTAGSIPCNIFAPYHNNYGVLYPLQTISKEQPIDYNTLPLFIEANNNENLKRVRTIAEKISQNVYDADSKQREQLHLAAVIACNFSNHLYYIAQQLLIAHNLPPQALLPLITESLNKLQKLTPYQAQTGPAARGDKAIIDKHLQMLTDKNQQDIYRLLSESILNTYHPSPNNKLQ